MKKFIFFLFLLSFFSSISFAKTSFYHEILGSWECIEIGDYEKYAFSLPSKITFFKNGTFTESLSYHSYDFILKGKYKVILSKKLHFIELTIESSSGTGWEEYNRMLNRANASGLGLNHQNLVFPLAHLVGGKNTGLIKLEKDMLLINKYRFDFEPKPKDFKGAMKYKKTN